MPADVTYRFGDLTIAANLPLTSLPRSRTARPVWRVRFREGTQIGRHDSPYHTWRDETGRAVVTFTRVSTRRVISFPNVARFEIDVDTRAIVCTSTRRTAQDLVRQLLIHQVLPLVAGLDRLALHASAVVMGSRGIAFVGPSGTGKSTIAARLAHRGCPLITDDVVLMEQRGREPHVLPMRAPIRLWPDAVRALIGAPAPSALRRVGPASDKRVLWADEARICYARTSVPLGTVFLMDGEADDLSIVPVAARDAVPVLIRHAFVLATDDPAHATRMLDDVSRVLAHARVYRVTPPASFEDLDCVLDALLVKAAA